MKWVQTRSTVWLLLGVRAGKNVSSWVSSGASWVHSWRCGLFALSASLSLGTPSGDHYCFQDSIFIPISASSLCSRSPWRMARVEFPAGLSRMNYGGGYLILPGSNSVQNSD